MKNKKSLLIKHSQKITKESLYILSKLPYNKIIVISNFILDNSIKIPSKIEIVNYNNWRDLITKINEVIAKYNEYLIIPSFTWDDNSKYSININNKVAWTKVDYKIFKQKDVMTDFLWDIAKKKFKKFSYQDIQAISYKEIVDQVSETIIIKPTNAHSSTSTFKVENEIDFDNIKPKLSKKYDYIAEEYINWELYSLDFFFDWENCFLLSYIREVAMIELLDKDKFSEKFLEKYWESIKKYFNFVLPMTYIIDFSKLAKIEINLLQNLLDKLKSIWYIWAIHLEYKLDSKNNKIWFIEWWARYGWYRRNYIKWIYNTDTSKIPYYIQVEKDFSRFKELKKWVYVFKEREHNLNFVRIKTNFLEKTNYIKILKKSGDIYKTSINQFLKEYYKEKFWIKVKQIDFYVKHSPRFNFYPFYENNETKFDYILELDDENFAIFKKKKIKILENVFFHDYN